MSIPQLLDLCCGEGGASRGYSHRFLPTGVDNKPARLVRYPFRKFCTDALEYVAEYGHKYAAIHASVPCQGYMRTVPGLNYPLLIEPMRELLIATGRPWVMENVEGAPLHDPMTLCGSMFPLTTVDDDGTALWLKRHRLWESNIPLVAPGPCQHKVGERCAGAYGGARRNKDEAKHIRRGGYVPPKPVLERLMGINWMTEKGLFESIPPAYSEWVGEQLYAAL